ncbi:LPD23 domain-containing protein [Photobacterium kishitanii]|uniref:Large polyvalent protein associated domain-containing protein n=1 Tax=Photobacterium kishitanii TaxID=318456 RepID=A0A2T3KM20_9GAMM|nr:LPD23 domain-containing protein [Photobacterium kishitanii]PSV00690.1 hypothetical protein C9J27_05995 [Photobacterium kishitanii]
MFIGDLSEGIDKTKLQEAKELHTLGVTNEDVRKQTGWFVGIDDEWRMELDDSHLELSDSFKRAMMSSHLQATKVSAVTIKIENPNLNTVQLTLTSKDGSSQVLNSVPINDISVFIPQKIANELTTRLSLGREHSHTYGDVEFEFRPGVKCLPVPKIFKNDNLSEHYHTLWGDFVRVNKSTATVGGLASVVDDGDGLVMTLSSELLTRGSDKIKDVVLHELQHMVQRYNGWAVGGSPQDFIEKNLGYEKYVSSVSSARATLELESEDVQNAYLKQMEMFLNAFSGDDAFDDKYLEYIDKIDEEFPQLWNISDGLYPEGISILGVVTKEEQYWYLAGEVEARLTSSRMDMSKSERAEKSPIASGWVKRNQRVFKSKAEIGDFIKKEHANHTELYSTAHVVDVCSYANSFANIMLDKTVTADVLIEQATRIMLEMHSSVYDELEVGNPAKETFDVLTAYMEVTPHKWGYNLDYMEREKLSKKVAKAFMHYMNGDDAPIGLAGAFDSLKEWVGKIFNLLGVKELAFDRPKEVEVAIKGMFKNAKKPSLESDFQKCIFDGIMTNKTVQPAAAMSIAAIIDSGYETLSNKTGIDRNILNERFPVNYRSRSKLRR